MSADQHQSNKRKLSPLRAALYDFDEKSIHHALKELFAEDAKVRLAHPFEDLGGYEALLSEAILPLQTAIPDLERRDWLVIGGTAENSEGSFDWVGCGGHYTGRFVQPFLDIPPTGHQASMRFHEFYRFQDGKVVEMQALWDIPELMLQANAWPLSPSLGREWLVPGPAKQDGLLNLSDDPQQSATSLQLVIDMLTGLSKSTQGPAAMQLEKYWHPKFSWYGPAGIGTTRGVQGFRDWHQIPFLNAMPDRVAGQNTGNLFADRSFVGFTAWPGMYMSLSGDGWLGIPPTKQQITMRSLDFWRCEKGLIRENWVLVDLLHVYAQLGVDVLGRMREFNKARNLRL